MMGRLALLAGFILVGCVPSLNAGPPGMRFTSPREHELDPSLIELARGEPAIGEKALLVVYPRTGCSGSASAVFVDERAKFVGAIAPGTAGLLNVPKNVTTMTLLSSVDVTAPVGTWHDAKRITMPNPATLDGIVIRTTRWSARECATGQYFDLEIASKQSLENELGESDVRWVAKNGIDGQAWLDRHGTRIAEVLSTPPSGPPGDITHLVLR